MEARERLCFYSEDEATGFNADIANDNTFKCFEYKTKLLGNAVAQLNQNQTNGILTNAAVYFPLIYLSNIWRPLEMPLINCKVELKLKQIKYCVFSAAGNDNTNDNPNNIINKGLEVFCNEYKTKNGNKNATNE